MQRLTTLVSFIILLSLSATASADYIIGGLQRLRTFDSAAPSNSLNSPIDIVNSPVGSLLIDPVPNVNSKVDVDYAYAQNQDAASLTWNVDQRRAAFTTSTRSSWSVDVEFSSTEAFAYTLNLNWNGLNITNGSGIIAIELQENGNSLLSETASVLNGTKSGAVSNLYSGTLSANTTYVLTLQTVLLFLPDQSQLQSATSVGSFSLSLTAVPEPNSAILLGLGCLLFTAFRRRLSLS